MRLSVGAVAAALIVLTGAFPTRADRGTDELPWTDNFGEALKRSVSAGKPVLVDVWAVWCVPCKQMDQTTYRDPAVKVESANFVLVKVNADIQVPIIERYEVEAFPTVLFLDGKGNEIARFAGYRHASDLAPRMKSVAEGYADYQQARDSRSNSELVADYLMAAGNPAGASDRYRQAVKELAPDPDKREACEMKLAASQSEAGQAKAAIAVYDRLSKTSAEPGRRADALVAMLKTQIAAGKRKDAEVTLDRLAKEFPDRVPGVRQLLEK